jgi:hypothetical protein
MSDVGLPPEVRQLIKVMVKAREVLQEAEKRAPRADCLAAIEEGDVLVTRARSTCEAIMSSQPMMPAFCTLISRHVQHRVILGSFPETERAMIATALLLRVFLLATTTEAYILASEVWVSIRDKDDPNWDKLLPRDDPQRRDGVVIATASKSFFEVRTYYVEREGRRVKLLPVGRKQENFAASNPMLGNLFDGQSEDGQFLDDFIDDFMSKVDPNWKQAK